MINTLSPASIIIIIIITLTHFFVLISPTSADQITIRDGNFTDIDGLDPTITWENSAVLSNDVALQVSDCLLTISRDIPLPLLLLHRSHLAFNEFHVLASTTT